MCLVKKQLPISPGGLSVPFYDSAIGNPLVLSLFNTQGVTITQQPACRYERAELLGGALWCLLKMIMCIKATILFII